MQLRTVLNAAVDLLEQNDVGSPRLNAETLLLFVLNCNRAHLYAYPERELTDDEYQRYQDALAERARGVPAQYITGHQEFWGLDFIVSPSVLIPRPETEHVVETALELAKRIDRPLIIDIGTRVSRGNSTLFTGFYFFYLFFTIPDQGYTIMDATVIQKGAFDFRQFDSIPPDFDLLIRSPQEFDIAVL